MTILGCALNSSRISYSKLLWVALSIAGLWPHFSTPASWLAAAILSGVVYLLGGSSLRGRPIWWLLSVVSGVAVWLVRSRIRLVVYPEQLLPKAEPGPISMMPLALVVIACVTVVGILGHRRVAQSRWRISGLLALALAMQIVSSVQVGATVRHLSRFEPGDYSYNFDGVRYLKSFYLLKRGLGWYKACVESTRVDARGPFAVPRVVMNYRLPTLYVLLSFLPNGDWISPLFVLLSCFGMWAVFDALRRLQVGVENEERAAICALSGALLLSPYLLLGAVTWFYTFHEYWAWFAAAASINLLLRRQYSIAIALGIFSACIREHFLLIPGVLSIPVWRSRDLRNRIMVCAGWVLLFCVYGLHIQRAMPYTGQGIGGGAAIWFHWPSLNSLENATLFGTTLYPWNRITAPLFLCAALWGLWRYRSRWESVCLIGLISIPVLAYLIIGPMTESGGYWGIVYMPWVFLAAPLVGAFERA